MISNTRADSDDSSNSRSSSVTLYDESESATMYDHEDGGDGHEDEDEDETEAEDVDEFEDDEDQVVGGITTQSDSDDHESSLEPSTEGEDTISTSLHRSGSQSDLQNMFGFLRDFLGGSDYFGDPNRKIDTIKVFVFVCLPSANLCPSG